MQKTRHPQILIIDDEPMVLTVLSKMISQLGLEIDTAKNGEEGVKKIQSNRYSLIITDVVMMGITGRQVLEYSKNSHNKSTPVIGISGTPWHLENAPFDAVLSKPFLKKDLLKTIRNFIQCSESKKSVFLY